MHCASITIVFLAAMLAGCTDGDVTADSGDDDLELGCCDGDPSEPANPPQEPGDPLGPITADVAIEVAGVGLAIGLDPVCGLSLSAEFLASASAEAVYDGSTWTLATVDPSVALTVGDGCACSGIVVQAIAGITLHAETAVSQPMCADYCAGRPDLDACTAVCDRPGNLLTASASLGATLDVTATGDALDLAGLLGEVIELGNWVLCDAAGVAI